MSDNKETIEMERFTGKDGYKYDSGKNLASVSETDIHIMKPASDLIDHDEFSYVNFYISKDNERLGIKPVTGGDVDRHSYKMTGYTASPQAVLNEIDVELGWQTKRFEVECDTENDMWVIDFTKEHRYD